MSQALESKSKHRNANLLVSLLLVIAVTPFVHAKMGSVSLFEVLVFVAALGGVYANTGSVRRLVLSGGLAIAMLGCRIAWEPDQPGNLVYIFLGGYALFFALVAVWLTQRLFESGQRVSADTLFGAFSVYLILGLIWVFLYSMLEIAHPGSFNFGDRGVPAREQFDRFLGFSFTTLTTLGYGNISPATARADALTTLEAIAGQVYLAVVIARLVAIELSQHARS